MSNPKGDGWEEGAEPSTEPKPNPTPSAAPQKANPKPLPDNVVDCLKLMREIEATMPSANRKQQIAKAQALAPVKEQYIRLQQGLPVTHITSHDQAKAHPNSRAQLKREQEKILSREHPTIKEIIEERDAALKTNASLGEKIAALEAEIDRLKSA